MAVTEGKKKKPPTFHYLPKSRAKRLKKSWIEDHKLRSKWKAQKKKEGLINQTTSAPVEDASNHRHDEVTVDSESDTSPKRLDKSPTTTPVTPPRDKQSLHDLRRIAYASRFRTQKADSLCSKEAGRSHNNRGGKATVGREAGQPNMKLRMNVLLEKIKRDL